MYHKDAHKLRGISVSFVKTILQTETFKNEAKANFSRYPLNPDKAANLIVREMGIRSKKKVTNSYRMGLANLGNPSRPGRIRMNVFVKIHPAQVAETLLHEMIHSVFGYHHGDKFNRVLAGVAKELWNIDINIARSWSDVYEIDRILSKKMKPHFAHLPTANGSFLWKEYIDILKAERAKLQNNGLIPKVAAPKSIRSYDFKHGDMVQWTHKNQKHFGEITRINKKRYSIIDSAGSKWLVPPRFVSLYTA